VMGALEWSSSSPDGSVVARPGGGIPGG
jgi:hypothetical protein